VAKLLYAVLLGLIGAVLVHLTVLLLILPYSGSALWTRLSRETTAYRFVTLPADNPVSKTADPFFRLKLCRFNLEESPAHLAAAGDVPFWSLSIYTQKGENIYSINSNTAPDNVLNMIAVNPLEIMDFKHNMPEAYIGAAVAALNSSNNFAILRALLPSADWQKQVEDFFAGAKCERIDY